MSENLKNPKPFDVVLGGNNPPKTKSIKYKKKLTETNNKVPFNSSTKSNHIEDSSISLANSSDSPFIGCFTILKWLFYGLGAYSMFTDSGDGFFLSIYNIASGAFFFGLINPSLAIRFGLPKSRWTITLIYLPIIIIYNLLTSSNP